MHARRSASSTRREMSGDHGASKANRVPDRLAMRCASANVPPLRQNIDGESSLQPVGGRRMKRASERSLMPRRRRKTLRLAGAQTRRLWFVTFGSSRGWLGAVVGVPHSRVRKARRGAVVRASLFRVQFCHGPAHLRRCADCSRRNPTAMPLASSLTNRWHTGCMGEHSCGKDFQCVTDPLHFAPPRQ